jgi:phytol kinase
MLNEEGLWNFSLMLLCYAYILFVIFASGKLSHFFHVSLKSSRKFLHMMIGNLPFVIPFFTLNIFPFLVAVPFVLVTFFVSPYSPFPSFGRRLAGLAGITEEGHHLGLVLYAVSYSVLALVLASRPFVIAAGVLPMAYGDAAASIVGEKYGRRRYKVLANKSLEGSAAMFFASFFSVAVGLVFFSALYSFSIFDRIFVVFAVAAVATLVEGLSPLGFDNLVVPFTSALTFLVLSGGV